MPSGWPRRFCCDDDLALIGYDGRFAAKELPSWVRIEQRRQLILDIGSSRDGRLGGGAAHRLDFLAHRGHRTVEQRFRVTVGDPSVLVHDRLHPALSNLSSPRFAAGLPLPGDA
jgi:hypothetical protein